MSDHALRHATSCAGSAEPRETGGVLLGFRSGRDVYVTDVVEVRGEVATNNRYVSTENDRNDAIASFLGRAGNEHPVGYVGTWHSHPGNTKASPIDKRTLRAEAVDAPDLVAMVVLFASGEGWCPDGYVAHHHRTMEHRRRHRFLRRDPWVTPAVVVLLT